MIAIDDIKKTKGNEMAAIILCCRVFFATAAKNELENFILDNEINWESFTYLCRVNRVRPVVYKIIYQADIPPKVKLFIHKQNLEITKRNWQHAIETERLILLLKKNDIEAVPYKGVVFSKQFFGNLASRENSDIDLVIKPADLDRALVIMKNDGYEPELEDVYLFLGPRYFLYHKDFNLNKFKGTDREFHVELHWAISENHTCVNHKANAFLYQAAGQMECAKTSIKVLDPTAHFSAMLIHHGIKDTFRYLKNVVDISQAIRLPSIQDNSGTLYKSFADLNLKKLLAVGNMLSDQLMGISLLEANSLDASAPIAEHFLNQACAKKSLPLENKGTLALWINNRALLQDSFSKKSKFYYVSFLHRFIPNQTDFRVIQFPKSLFFLYYFMKPFRSFIKPHDILAEKRKLVPVG